MAPKAQAASATSSNPGGALAAFQGPIGPSTNLMSMVAPAAINPIQVGRDIRLALRRAVIGNSSVTESTFDWDLVPSKEPLDGFGADLGGWLAILRNFEAKLRKLDDIYDVFKAQPRHAKATLDSSLEATVQALRAEITDLLTR